MKKSIAAILAGALCLSALTACGGSTSSSDSSAAANTGDSDKVITVGATPTPHAEILNAARTRSRLRATPSRSLSSPTTFSRTPRW